MDTGKENEIRKSLERVSSPQLCAIRSELFESSWQPEAIEIAGEILRERGIERSAIQDCPICHGVLEGGSVQVRGKPLGSLGGLLELFSGGSSEQHLWFEPVDSGAK